MAAAPLDKLLLHIAQLIDLTFSGLVTAEHFFLSDRQLRARLVRILAQAGQILAHSLDDKRHFTREFLNSLVQILALERRKSVLKEVLSATHKACLFFFSFLNRQGRFRFYYLRFLFFRHFSLHHGDPHRRLLFMIALQQRLDAVIGIQQPVQGAVMVQRSNQV